MNNKDQIKTAISVVKQLFRQLVLSGHSTTESIEILFADGTTPFELAHFFSSNEIKPDSVKRSANRIKNRLSVYDFVNLSNGCFSIDFSIFRTDLSPIYNNNTYIQSKQNSKDKNKNIKDLESSNNNIQEDKDNDVSKEAETDNAALIHTEDEVSQIVNNIGPIGISKQMVSDAKYMVELLGGKFLDFQPSQALTAIIATCKKKQPYNSEIVRKSIERAFLQIDYIKTNPAGYFLTIFERKRMAASIEFDTIQRRPYIKPANKESKGDQNQSRRTYRKNTREDKLPKWMTGDWDVPQYSQEEFERKSKELHEMLCAL